VLNALRHQRLGNCPALTETERKWGAQRLAASTVGKRSNTVFGAAIDRKCSTPCGINGWETSSFCLDLFYLYSAQRLAASTVGKPLDLGDRLRHPVAVLNALRHQRLGNWQGKVFWAQQQRCAQRLAASTVGKLTAHSCLVAISLCSTPCGINGWETRRTQRSNNFICQCSTPCGINGWETAVKHRHFYGHACAQRLAASTVGKLGIGRAVATARSCSTPCGINGWETYPPPSP